MTRRRWFTVLGLTLVLHAVLAAVLYVSFWSGDGAAEPAVDAAAVAAAEPEPPPEEPAVDELLDERLAEVDQLEPDQQMQELRRQSHLVRQIDPASIDRASAVVERTLNLPDAGQRAWAPDPSATGPFDPDTASIYDVRRTAGEDGGVVYEWVMIDAAGRQLIEQRPADQMTEADLRAARVFEMTQGNERMRALVDVVRRYADQQADD